MANKEDYMKQTCANCIYKNRKWGDNPCRTCMESGNDIRENWMWNGEKEDKGE